MPTYDNNARGAILSATGGSVTVNITPLNAPAGHDCFVGASIEYDRTGTAITVSSITDSAGGNVWTRKMVDTYDDGSAAPVLDIELWQSHLTNAITSVTINVSAAVTYDCTFIAASYGGVTGYGKTGNNTGTSTLPTLTLPILNPDSWGLVITGIGQGTGGGASFTPSAGNLRLNITSLTLRTGIAFMDNTSTTCSGTLSGIKQWVAIGVELQSAGFSPRWVSR